MGGVLQDAVVGQCVYRRPSRASLPTAMAIGLLVAEQPRSARACAAGLGDRGRRAARSVAGRKRKMPPWHSRAAGRRAVD